MSTPSAPTVSRVPLWGRAYKLSVLTALGEELVISESGWEPEALRVVFEVQESVLPSPFWYATIVIYNVTDQTLQNLLWLATWVTLEAGYQTGKTKSTIIWDGPVLQKMFDRQHVVDSVIIFNCVVGNNLLTNNFQNWAASSGFSQYHAVSKMIGDEGGVVSAQLSKLATEVLQGKTYPRGKTYWGASGKYIGDSGDDNFMTHFISKDNASHITELADPAVDQTPEIIYGPPYPPGYVTSGGGPTDESDITRSIIGSPRAFEQGVTMEVLLDPRLHVGTPPMVIQIEQTTLISQFRLQGPGGKPPPSPLTASGIYVVGQVTHHGDTRGNDWYSTVQCFAQGYCQNLLDGVWNAIQKGVKAPGG